MVLRNRQGQRVDSRLDYRQEDYIALKGRKLCNSFHILGRCQYRGCSHEHGEKLSPRETVALRAVARLSPCSKGLNCADPDCFSGHRCAWDTCQLGSKCRFPAAMHNVDTKPVV